MGWCPVEAIWSSPLPQEWTYMATMEERPCLESFEDCHAARTPSLGLESLPHNTAPPWTWIPLGTRLCWVLGREQWAKPTLPCSHGAQGPGGEMGRQTLHKHETYINIMVTCAAYKGNVRDENEADLSRKWPGLRDSGRPPWEAGVQQRSEASDGVIWASGGLGKERSRPSKPCVRRSWGLLKDRGRGCCLIEQGYRGSRGEAGTRPWGCP